MNGLESLISSANQERGTLPCTFHFPLGTSTRSACFAKGQAAIILQFF